MPPARGCGARAGARARSRPSRRTSRAGLAGPPDRRDVALVQLGRGIERASRPVTAARTSTVTVGPSSSRLPLTWMSGASIRRTRQSAERRLPAACSSLESSHNGKRRSRGAAAGRAARGGDQPLCGQRELQAAARQLRSKLSSRHSLGASTTVAGSRLRKRPGLVMAHAVRARCAERESRSNDRDRRPCGAPPYVALSDPQPFPALCSLLSQPAVNRSVTKR